MFSNLYIVRIMFLVGALVARINYAASSSEVPAFDPQQLFEGGIESQYELNRQIMQGGPCDKKVQLLLTRYRADLPSHGQALQHIEAITQRHPEWASEFTRKIDHLQNPRAYRAIRYPSRMVYHGSSGCGKTYTALALAKVCDMECLLIHGSSIETSYRRSGPDFLDNLFQTLLDHPERRFLIVLDELKYLAQYSKDERETDQHATVTKLWQCLDQIEKERHICVVGTDNLDPKEYEPQMQTRFFNSIFRFNQTDSASTTRLSSSVLSSIIDSRLPSSGPSSSSASNSSEFSKQPIRINALAKPITWSFSEKKLNELSTGISHLTEREKLELIDTAAEIAIFQESAIPSDSSETIIAEHHLNEAFRKHRRTYMQRFFAHPTVQQLYSVRALSYYIAAASFGLRMVDAAYIPYSAPLLAVSQLVNAINTDDKQRSYSLQLLGSLHNVVASQESDRRYHYALKWEQDAIQRDAGRYKQSREDRTNTLKREADRYQESRNNYNDDLIRDADRYAESREDHMNARKREADRYQESRNDYSDDVSRDLKRYAESREDRDNHIRRQTEQSETLHNMTLRANYLKNLDMPMYALDQGLKAARSLENMQERAVVVERLWKDFEKVLIIETHNRDHEITHTRGMRGRVLNDYTIAAIKQLYKEHDRAMPEDMRVFVMPANLFLGFR